MSCFLRRLCLGFIVLMAPWLPADEVEVEAEEPIEVSSRYSTRTPVEIERVVGRLALFPDVLVALMLPASRDPVHIVLAARAVRADGDRQDFSEEPWSESVKRLAHYPDALFLLDEDLEWTTELGEIFSAQPADVMDAIQAVRERARKLGYLRDTRHQVVVVQERVIRIHPCNWDYIYIPSYNWRRLYSGAYCGPDEVFFSFGVIGFSSGHWRGFDCDWRARRVWISPSVRITTRGHPWPHNRIGHDDRRPEHRDRPARVNPRRDRSDRPEGRSYPPRERAEAGRERPPRPENSEHVSSAPRQRDEQGGGRPTRHWGERRDPGHDRPRSSPSSGGREDRVNPPAPRETATAQPPSGPKPRERVREPERATSDVKTERASIDKTANERPAANLDSSRGERRDSPAPVREGRSGRNDSSGARFEGGQRGEGGRHRN